MKETCRLVEEMERRYGLRELERGVQNFQLRHTAAEMKENNRKAGRIRKVKEIKKKAKDIHEMKENKQEEESTFTWGWNWN